MEGSATSLLTTEVTEMITGFAGQIVPTAMGILSIVVPVALSCWGIGFALKKGLAYLKRNAGKAL